MLSIHYIKFGCVVLRSIMLSWVKLCCFALPPLGGSNIELDSVALSLVMLSYVVLSYVTAFGRAVVLS